MTQGFPDPRPFIEQAYRILEAAKERNVTVRLIGALAFHLRCPDYNYVQMRLNRFFTDIDFMAYFSQRHDVEQLFKDLGYVEDVRVKTVPGLRRAIFFHRNHPWHSDVFYDVLDFSHEIDLRGRLELDYPTLSLVDLLLEKLQIAQINRKDVIDTVMLLRQHDIDDSTSAKIQIDHLARLTKANWGLWKTVTTNLEKIDQLADMDEVLTEHDRHIIRGRLRHILARIDDEPPTLRWRLRSRIGERIKWYRDVDEVQ
jgi:hypothetical protein